jgi:hypothetical protein
MKRFKVKEVSLMIQGHPNQMGKMHLKTLRITRALIKHLIQATVNLLFPLTLLMVIRTHLRMLIVKILLPNPISRLPNKMLSQMTT